MGAGRKGQWCVDKYLHVLFSGEVLPTDLGEKVFDDVIIGDARSMVEQLSDGDFGCRFIFKFGQISFNGTV